MSHRAGSLFEIPGVSSQYAGRAVHQLLEMLSRHLSSTPIKQIAKHLVLSARSAFQSDSFVEIIVARLWILTPNVASEGRRSAQHGGVPSTGWLGDEASPVSKPAGLDDAEGQQGQWPSVPRGFRRSDVRGAQHKTVQALNHSPPRQAPREPARTADWHWKAGRGLTPRAHRQSSMRDGPAQTFQAFDHRPARLALRELARFFQQGSLGSCRQ